MENRALHLADLITEMNGTSSPCLFSHFPLSPKNHPSQWRNMWILTDSTGFCGFMSITSSMRYCLGPPTNRTPLWFALAFMPLGLFFDFMDGKVARWRGKSSLMGQELDSLADLVRFSLSAHCSLSTNSPSPSSTLRRGIMLVGAGADIGGYDRSLSASPPPSWPSPSASAPRSTLSSSPSSSSAALPASPAST